MDRLARKDIAVASAVGTALAVGTLMVGVAFGPSSGSAVPGLTGDGGRQVLQVTDERTAGAREALRAAAPESGGTTVDGTDALGAPVTTSGPDAGSRAAVQGGRGSGARPTTGSGLDLGAHGGGVTVPASPSTPGATPSQPTTPEQPSATSRVRLRVEGVTLTGTDSGTLEPGSEVRLRLATDTAPATTVADIVKALPAQLDLRLKLDADAVAQLKARAEGIDGPLALLARVDLVDDGTAGVAPPRLRVRLQLAEQTAGEETVTTDDTATGDGVSNVVEVRAPIGTGPASTPSGRPTAPATPDPTTPAPTTPSGGAPVEVRLTVPSTAGTPSDGGTSVALPLPDSTSADPGTEAGNAGVGVLVHVPETDEPLGGTPVVGGGGAPLPGDGSGSPAAPGDATTPGETTTPDGTTTTPDGTTTTTPDGTTEPSGSGGAVSGGATDPSGTGAETGGAPATGSGDGATTSGGATAPPASDAGGGTPSGTATP